MNKCENRTASFRVVALKLPELDRIASAKPIIFFNILLALSEVIMSHLFLWVQLASTFLIYIYIVLYTIGWTTHSININKHTAIAVTHVHILLSVTCEKIKF